jgi:uncharacterized protein with PIN domain
MVEPMLKFASAISATGSARTTTVRAYALAKESGEPPLFKGGAFAHTDVVAASTIAPPSQSR